MDRGFIFGDGLYEAIPYLGGTPFRFDDHMSRLERSLAEMRIPNPYARHEWLNLVHGIARRYGEHAGEDLSTLSQLIYIQITRGVAMRDHAMPLHLKPTVFVTANRLPTPSQEAVLKGVRCITAKDFRWEKAHIKTTSLLGNVFARQMSADQGCPETILFRGEYLSEGSCTNVWVVKDSVVLGPPADNLVLEGVRYKLIQELCITFDIPFALRPITWDEFRSADEVFLSSATKELLPVTRYDLDAIGDGTPGPVFMKLHAGYQAAKAAAIQSGGRGLSQAPEVHQTIFPFP